MSNRSDEIDEELRHLARLASQLTDERTLRSIGAMVTDLEAEKAALKPDQN